MVAVAHHVTHVISLASGVTLVMPGGQLPEGLVTTNNETVREEIGNVDRVDLKDVARLWRGTLKFPHLRQPIIDAEGACVDPCPTTCKY